ncbi:MAG: transposase [Anaerolineae bacterium]|nr:transposase [Anaerolineae bacterium]MBN8617603.1 transposase [Anaerolineae bacterium]
MGRGSQFTEEFKQEAVRKAEANQSVSRTARELRISNKTLHQRMKKFATGSVGFEHGAVYPF